MVLKKAESGKLASFTYFYDNEDKKWIAALKGDINYLLKD